MASAAAAGLGVALVPFAMFNRELASELLVQPFAVEIDVGRYWLTRLNSRPETAAMRQFRDWLMDEIDSAFFQALP
jgi:LysR family transcriptional regulator of beta-lactamase